MNDEREMLLARLSVLTSQLPVIEGLSRLPVRRAFAEEDQDFSASLKMEAFDSFETAVRVGGWIIPGFSWWEWIRTEEAVALRENHDGLDRATPTQLSRLLTVLIGQRRFCTDVLDLALENGLLVDILKRADRLAAALEWDDSEETACFEAVSEMSAG